MKENGSPGDVWGERQQDSRRAQTCGREKREQSVVLKCQEAGVVTRQLSFRCRSIHDVCSVSLQESAFVLVNDLNDSKMKYLSDTY